MTRSARTSLAAVLRSQAAAAREQAKTLDGLAAAIEAESEADEAPSTPAALLTKNELATALGCSTATIDRDAVIPYLLVGESRRYSLPDVLAALAAKRAAVAAERNAPQAPKDSREGLVRVLTRRTGGER